MKQSMELQFSQVKPMIKIEFNEQKDYFVVRIGKISEIISANFIRHQLGIPYEKKSGEVVTAHDIEVSKRKNRKALAQAMTRKLAGASTLIC